jgi:hypothetical protein
VKITFGFLTRTSWSCKLPHLAPCERDMVSNQTPRGIDLCRAALQPMFGQLANVFGRRRPMLLSVTTFMIGSGICGGWVVSFS